MRHRARALAPLATVAVTVGLHLRHRNALPSILGGTATHVDLCCDGRGRHDGGPP